MGRVMGDASNANQLGLKALRSTDILLKTERGRATLSGAATEVLSSWAKHLLRIVDGKRSVAELDKLLPQGQKDSAFNELLILGLIVVSETPEKANVASKPLDATQVSNFKPLIIAASNKLTRKLGPDADRLTLKLEACKSPSELKVVLSQILPIISSRLGTEFAADFERLLACDQL